MVKGFKKHLENGKMVKIVGKVNQDFSLEYLDDYPVDDEKMTLDNINKVIMYTGNELISSFFY